MRSGSLLHLPPPSSLLRDTNPPLPSKISRGPGHPPRVSLYYTYIIQYAIIQDSRCEFGTMHRKPGSNRDRPGNRSCLRRSVAPPPPPPLARIWLPQVASSSAARNQRRRRRLSPLRRSLGWTIIVGAFSLTILADRADEIRLLVAAPRSLYRCDGIRIDG